MDFEFKNTLESKEITRRILCLFLRLIISVAIYVGCCVIHYLLVWKIEEENMRILVETLLIILILIETVLIIIRIVRLVKNINDRVKIETYQKDVYVFNSNLGYYNRRFFLSTSFFVTFQYKGKTKTVKSARFHEGAFLENTFVEFGYLPDINRLVLIRKIC